MSILSTATVSVVFAIAKHIVSEWVGEGVLASIVDENIDDYKEPFKEWISHKDESSQFVHLAKQITAQMSVLWETESPHLPESSRNAIVHALRNTLTNPPIDADMLIQHQLDHKRLVNSLKASHATEISGFDSQEEALYQRLLAETCSQLIYVANYLRGYTPLMDRLRLVQLEELVQNTQKLMAGPDEHASAYEEAYRQNLATHLNHFEQIGNPYVQELLELQNLQKAYVNLRLEQTDSIERNTINQLGGDQNYVAYEKAKKDDKSAGASIRGPIQQILSATPRIMIQGQPGSGKSTLMRWLAMSIANQQLGQEYPALKAGTMLFHST